MLLSRSIAEMIGAALVLLLSMSVHEFAHNYVGYRMGDPTPRDLGRLTLNPFVHINWVGFAMWVILGFGILGSAPISEHRMRDRRWGYLWAVAAGPLSNLLLAVLFAIPIRLNLIDASMPTGNQLLPTFANIITLGFTYNILLFLFNLLPFFPFDGWHILRKLLPPDLGYQMQRYERESTFAFLALFLLSYVGIFNFFTVVLGPPTNFLYRLLLG